MATSLIGAPFLAKSQLLVVLNLRILASGNWVVRDAAMAQEKNRNVLERASVRTRNPNLLPT